MNKYVKAINTKKESYEGKGTVRINIKDYFPNDKSGIMFFDVSLEAYNDLCQYKELMDSVVNESNDEAVRIDVRRFYPHLCKKEKWIYITEEMLENQIDHINSRKQVLIKIKDLQKEYKDCPVFMEVSNEICMQLAVYRSEDADEDNKYRRRCDGKGFDEVSRGEINGMYQQDNTKNIDLLLTVKYLFMPYGEILTKRAIMYLCYAQTPTKIARCENISVHAAWESVEKK